MNCKIMNMSFSAHTDAKGIKDLIEYLQPDNVVLVHGEKEGMAQLKEEIWVNWRCFDPPNHSIIDIETSLKLPFQISTDLINKYQMSSTPSHPYLTIPSLIMSKKKDQVLKF